MVMFQMWGIEYVQVPTNESPAHTGTSATAAEPDNALPFKKDNTAGNTSAQLFAYVYYHFTSVLAT